MFKMTPKRFHKNIMTHSLVKCNEIQGKIVSNLRHDKDLVTTDLRVNNRKRYTDRE